MKRILLSGIQPTGVIHIGNYLGFLRRFVQLQNDPCYDKKILAIADLHTISTGIVEAKQLRNDIRHSIAIVLAAGIDPEKSLVIQQSRLAEHTELMWILGASTTLAQLSSMGQFKDKSKAYKHGAVPINLLTYPLLQAADILIYKATDVLVGSDQKQHIYMVKEAVDSFHRRIGFTYFPNPKWISSSSPKIQSLKHPMNKMSKSDRQENARISLNDPEDVVINKIKGALSDFNPKITFEPEARPGISNLVNLFSAFTGLSTDEIIEESKHLDTLGFKLKLASIINEELDPIRENYKTLMSNDRHLLDILEKSEAIIRPTIRETLKDVKSIIGME